MKRDTISKIENKIFKLSVSVDKNANKLCAVADEIINHAILNKIISHENSETIHIKLNGYFKAFEDSNESVYYDLTRNEILRFCEFLKNQ